MRIKSHIIIFALILFSICSFAQYSDCTPDYTVTDSEGIGIREPVDLPVAFEGEYYESFFTIIPPVTANTWGVLNTTITKIQVTELVNLPEGLVAESNSNNEDDFLIGGEHYCYSLKGTPLANPGIHKIDVYANAWIRVIFEVSAPGNPQYGGDITFTMCSELNLDLGEDRSITTDDEITISADQNNDFHSYEWSNGCTNATCTINGADLGIGTHELSVIVRDTVGTTGIHNGSTTRCWKTDAISISVTEGNAVPIINKKSINIYPNPSNGIFTLESKSNSVSDFSILDMNGEEVFASEIQSTKQDFNISHLSKGVYIVKLNGFGNKIYKKLILQ